MSEFSKTTYYEQAVLNQLFSKMPFSVPDTLYLALCTADPGADGDTTSEISDPAYARQPISSWTAAQKHLSGSGSFVQNVLDVDFPAASIDWGRVYFGVLLDAATGGNAYYKGAFDVAKEVLTNDYFQVPAGELVIKED